MIRVLFSLDILALLTPQLIRLGTTELPCSASEENLRCDIYEHEKDTHFRVAGTVSHRLNVLSEPRAHSSLAQTLPTRPVRPDISSTLSSRYSVTTTDTLDEMAAKFLAYVALGPTTKDRIAKAVNPGGHVPSKTMAAWLASNTQAYLANDAFIEADRYPTVEHGLADSAVGQPLVYLKDKAYKELRPWLWPHYTEKEREMIVGNAGNALTRLGYLETHPLRKRVVEKTQNEGDAVRKSKLGGGMLVGKHSHATAAASPSLPVVAVSKSSITTNNTPILGATHISLPVPRSSLYKRAMTDSPRIDDKRDPRQENNPERGSRTSRAVASLSLSASCSEDERGGKRGKSGGKRADSSGSNHSLNSVGTSLTLPSEDLSDDDDDNDVKNYKPLSKSSSKPPAHLPARPVPATADKKQRYYLQLAGKFKVKYKEYEQLHRELSRELRQGSTQEKKRKLMHLYEMHTSLAEWKKQLWDYHNQSNMAEGIMNLLKHRKTNLGSYATVLPDRGKKLNRPERAPDKMPERTVARPKVLDY